MAQFDVTHDGSPEVIAQLFGAQLGVKPRERKRISVKVFKSGNSLAMRLPASLGLRAGSEIHLDIEDDAHVSFDLPDKPKRKIDVAKFWGAAPGLTPIADEDRLFDEADGDVP